MITFSFPSSVTFTRLGAAQATVKQQLDDSRVESVTGRFADLTSAIGGDVGRVHLIEKQIADTDDRLTQIDLASAEFAVAQSTLSSISTAANSFANKIDVALGSDDDTTLKTLEAEIETELRLAFSQLNASAGGRHLFSGAATDKAAYASVDDFIADVKAIVETSGDITGITTQLDAYFADGGGVGTFEGDIYQGSDSVAPRREISANDRVGIELRGDDQAFKDILRGYASFLGAMRDSGLPTADRDAVFASAATSLRGGANALIDAQAKLGSAEGAAAEAKTRLTVERTTYQSLLSDIVSVDQAEAATLVQNLETQLQAIYLTTSRMTSLSLVNFLR